MVTASVKCCQVVKHSQTTALACTVYRSVFIVYIVPRTINQIIKNEYQNAQCAVKTKQVLIECFDGKVGVRKGFITSFFLCGVVMASGMQQTMCVAGELGDLGFAHDICVINKPAADM